MKILAPVLITLVLASCSTYSKSAYAKRGSPDVVDSSAPHLSREAAPQDARIRICSAAADLKCTELDNTAVELRRRAEAAGGWLQKQEGNSVELRLPSATFDLFLQDLKKLGEVQSLHRQTDDVTEQFLDLNLRLGNAEATLKRLQELQGKQGKVEDLLKIEQEISRLSGEIENLKGQRQLIEHNSRFSRLSLRLLKREAVIPLAGSQVAFAWMADLGRAARPGEFTAESLFGDGFNLELPQSLLLVQRDNNSLRAISADGLLLSAYCLSIQQEMSSEFWSTLLLHQLRDRAGRNKLATRTFPAWGHRSCLVFEDGDYSLYFIAGADHVVAIECRGDTKLRPADLEAAIASSEVNLNDWARY